MTDQTILVIASAVPPTLMALAALVASIKNSKKIEDLHIAVNSRLTELLEQTAKASKAEGVAEGTFNNKVK